MEQKSGTDSKTFPSDPNTPVSVNDRPKVEWTLYDYEALAMRTAKDFGTARMNLIHAAMGLCSDAGEACDEIKAHTIYGRELDHMHLIEELGDTLWFIALAAKSAGVTLDTVARFNIAKLKKRYPQKYSDEAAIARADKESSRNHGLDQD